ncbi:DNA-binding transcriptional LysR family regulator [Pseudomonas frederiksbergensis]|jgi:DNA-binding transcriptional LysR family regulator|uniref:DNA-binding transcriptional LysR family regulator n=2 Tax=Pseudomonas TaxID=286 RepID=A0ACC5ME30_9PSED|nr:MULTISPECIES: LysR family transcriptional regulator [Pseudomonas]ATE78534.1 LysR family transcriptional regulator [Pseudomonas frederiksbergensis]MBB2886875.1 DNA-binding transcriptional LysR family regulator [Pseudomonas umsongensis]MBD9607017.1 LysR family transcriptional regulator [Pseudomonas sp. PDM08]MBD9617093.1 LysR family transcriptional regulator [Pseudomonas sp. PDM07]MDR7107189.1 DNA-binding transcriptional LysR family regulator [Pseudomonas frederiksbergensis]
METLANLESFVRSAETGSFSAAARLLALTPAAVSRNVAMLERNIGVRLFQRSTRKLSLTEAGERFLASIGGNLQALQTAISAVSSDRGEPAGVLKVSLAPTFGIDHVLPLLPEFLARYPLIRLEWHFENRQVDLIAEGYDAAIGGGFELTPGVVSRTLAAADVVAVASPAYMAGRTLPSSPADLAQYNGIVMRGIRTGRVRQWVMRDSVGNEASAELSENIVLNDPAAMREAALLGLGVTLLVSPDVIAHIQHGELLRLLPDWHADAGSISLYYPSRTLMPAKTRVFIDYLVEAFERG